MSRLKLKRVLITGAARGLGRALAERAGERGAELVITDIQEDLLAETRDQLAAKGYRCRAFTLDVTDLPAIQETRAQINKDLGPIDMLVNNAGVVFGGAFLEVPIERHILTYRVNVEGVMAMTHAFLPDIEESPGGHVTFIASASGFVGLPNGTTYASSKWAVIGFAESLRAELKHQRRKNVKVTTVCPTYIATGMFEGVEPPKTTSMLDPQEISTKVIEAIERNKVWVLEPWIVKITPLLKHGLPTPVSDFLSDAFGATKSMDSWSGHGN